MKVTNRIVASTLLLGAGFVKGQCAYCLANRTTLVIGAPSERSQTD